MAFDKFILRLWLGATSCLKCPCLRHLKVIKMTELENLRKTSKLCILHSVELMRPATAWGNKAETSRSGQWPRYTSSLLEPSKAPFTMYLNCSHTASPANEVGRTVFWREKKQVWLYGLSAPRQDPGKQVLHLRGWQTPLSFQTSGLEYLPMAWHGMFNPREQLQPARKTVVTNPSIIYSQMLLTDTFKLVKILTTDVGRNIYICCCCCSR